MTWNRFNGRFPIDRRTIACSRCTRKEDGAEFAVKIVSLRFVGQANREAQILEICKDHRNIVKLIEVLSDKFHVYLVLELLKGPELLTRIRQAEKFTEAEAARIMRKLVSAVKFLHNKGAVHRDLKPEVILFLFFVFDMMNAAV